VDHPPAGSLTRLLLPRHGRAGGRSGFGWHAPGGRDARSLCQVPAGMPHSAVLDTAAVEAAAYKSWGEEAKADRQDDRRACSPVRIHRILILVVTIVLG
jgi:hypothetical protein